MTLTNLTTTLISGGDHTLATNEHDSARLPSPEPVSKLDLNLFEEIKEHLDRCVRFEREEKDDRSKIEGLNQIIDQAQEMVKKATEKKEALLKRNLMLKATLYGHEQKIRKSLEYWSDFGLDIQNVDGGFRFNYSKLSADDERTVSICIKSDPAAGELEIFAQEPEILNSEQLLNLNTVRLAKYCKNGTIDHRGAMLEIKKELVKSLASSSKKVTVESNESPNPSAE